MVALLEDLKAHDVDAVTIGQYLRPTKNHLPVAEYVHPDVFAEYKAIGEALGFLFVASGPFIRSSYNAKEFSDKFLAEKARAHAPGTVRRLKAKAGGGGAGASCPDTMRKRPFLQTTGTAPRPPALSWRALGGARRFSAPHVFVFLGFTVR